MTAIVSAPNLEAQSVTDVLTEIAAGAAARDRENLPEFPHEPIELLRRAGLLAFNSIVDRRPRGADELAMARAVARADASVGRIFDGHLNGVERLIVQAPQEIRAVELPAIRRGELVVGVWGGDPRPGDGTPATIEGSGATELLNGIKTFCSGAGGLDRALVLARDPDGDEPSAVWVDASDTNTVEIDLTWYRSSGLRASASHRVIFHGAPILARFGPPGALLQQPWFARDSIRTAATWAGMLDSAYEAAVFDLGHRPQIGDLEGLAVARMITARRTVDLWLDRAAHAIDAPDADLPVLALHASAAISEAARILLDQAARACGSHPFATGGTLDRSRRDLELFLLQHRLDPMLARAGGQELRPQK